MRAPYCSNGTCQERCIPRGMSVVLVLVSFTLASVVIMVNSEQVKPDDSVWGLFSIEITVGIVMFILAGAIALLMSLFEKFESAFTAVFFGLSTPGFVLGLAKLISF